MRAGVVYYWETINSSGQFRAGSDQEALKKMPSDCLALYRESDTEDGLPFIMVHEFKDTRWKS